MFSPIWILFTERALKKQDGFRQFAPEKRSSQTELEQKGCSDFTKYVEYDEENHYGKNYQ